MQYICTSNENQGIHKFKNNPNAFKYLAQVIGRDALRMRLRRLCEQKKGGKLHVKQAIHEDWKAAGERRELLELALLETIEKLGLEKASQSAVKSEFQSRVELVKERLTEREQELTGQWLTAERMESKLGYSRTLGFEYNKPWVNECYIYT